MKKLVFSLVVSSFVMINQNNFLFSAVIDQSSIDSNKKKIKVAAFSSKKSLTFALKKFENHSVYLEYKNRFVRFFIVNIQKENLERLSKDIKKDFPDAFIYRKRLNNGNSICLSNKVVVEKIKINSEKNKKKQINFLNSDTILQTRKKFY